MPSDPEGKKHVYLEGQSRGDERPTNVEFRPNFEAFFLVHSVAHRYTAVLDEVSGQKCAESAHVRKTEFIVHKNIDPKLQD